MHMYIFKLWIAKKKKKSLSPSHFYALFTLNSQGAVWTFKFANSRWNSLSTHMISQAPLTNSSSDLIPGSKRQKNLYLNLVHFNSTPEVPWEKNWIKVRQADSTAWKMNLSRCFWNMYLPCARAWEGEKENVIRLNNSLSSGGALLLTTQNKKKGRVSVNTLIMARRRATWQTGSGASDGVDRAYFIYIFKMKHAG